jgi:phosphoglycerate dehydrogenase-like enzyme
VGTDVVVTTASGIYSGPLAEFVLMGMLQHAKGLDLLRGDKATKTWRQGTTGTLERKTLCVVGTGSIGRAIADRARPFGMHVVGVKRAIREDDAAWASFDELHATQNLPEALAGADFVALTLPGTPETERLLDRETIATIKPGAFFANVGRGTVVEEAALVEALRGGHLSGAALDVFEVEPLPEESPLWEMENVIISAHTTDVVPELINAAQTDLFCENLRRFLAGEVLVNVLDKRLLY